MTLPQVSPASAASVRWYAASLSTLSALNACAGALLRMTLWAQSTRSQTVASAAFLISLISYLSCCHWLQPIVQCRRPGPLPTSLPRSGVVTWAAVPETIPHEDGICTGQNSSLFLYWLQNTILTAATAIMWQGSSPAQERKRRSASIRVRNDAPALSRQPIFQPGTLCH